MGRFTQKRLVRRLDLERALHQVKLNLSPKAYEEQYAISTDVAAEILFLAAYVNNDIIGKKVADLGCGTGRLAIGAVLLGAAETVGVDIDKEIVQLANKNAEQLGVQKETFWVIGDINVLHGHFDTVLQNPPFGVQKRSADQNFLLKALELAPRVYSLHKGGEKNRAFIKRFIEGHGGKTTGIFRMKLHIPRLFKFHTKLKHEVDVDLYRIIGM
jgi:putative methylase